MPRRLTIVVGVLLVGAAGAGAAPSSSRPRVACGPSGATTLAASHDARVYASGGSVYGCASGATAAIRLGARETCIGTPRVDPVAVTGPLAAYGLQTCGVDTGTTRVVVRRLTDGRRLQSAPATSPGGPESYQAVTSLVVKGDGAVAWIGRAQSLGTHRATVEVWRSDRHGLARLQSGGGIHVRSLRLSGSTLRWRDGGGAHTANLD